MVFQRFIEPGRIAYVNHGEDKGKLVAVVDVIDQNRVLVDGPNIPRSQIQISNIHLSKFKIRIPRTGSKKVIRKAWELDQIDEKWKASMWGKKLKAKEKRGLLSDFDRFKLRKAKQVRNKLRTSAFFRLKRLGNPSKQQ